MAERNQGGDLHYKLNLLFDELREQNCMVQNLKDELKGTAVTAFEEAKRLKKEKEMTWRFKGNKAQHEFNEEIVNILKHIEWSTEHGKDEYCRELVTEACEKIRKRNTLIRIADTSEGGWDTVNVYESNPVASDSDEDAKISRADNKATKKNGERIRGSIRIPRHRKSGSRHIRSLLHVVLLRAEEEVFFVVTEGRALHSHRNRP
ncbi:hypothetical protein DPMN_162042 [Dreissena polymorpha]|uniref:Uncharacterized protein n=1 Tax=Dreissena polymorpha TaxID=45954 RepID=A0A9D4ET94_DREPO|nr:hypothetical protein DPMN_162042 [Dreissena polymorpha]